MAWPITRARRLPRRSTSSAVTARSHVQMLVALNAMTSSHVLLTKEQALERANCQECFDFCPTCHLHKPCNWLWTIYVHALCLVKNKDKDICKACNIILPLSSDERSKKHSLRSLSGYIFHSVRRSPIDFLFGQILPPQKNVRPEYARPYKCISAFWQRQQTSSFFPAICKLCWLSPLHKEMPGGKLRGSELKRGKADDFSSLIFPLHRDGENCHWSNMLPSASLFPCSYSKYFYHFNCLP